MSRSGQARYWLAVVFAVGPLVVFPLAAETAPKVAAPPTLLFAPTNLLPPMVPHTRSPVDYFRKLLTLTPAERENALTNRPPEIRDRILAKVREYEALDPNERELRLRATELRWYLLPLMRDSRTNRAARLAAVPDDLRGLIKVRLTQWDMLPPPLQKEFLESDRALRYFTHLNSSNRPPSTLQPPGRTNHHGASEADLARWNSLPEERRQKIAAQFNRFFELTPVEKRKTLGTLSEAERQQMEKTLETFGKLSPAQRLRCIRAFTEFAGMNPAEKQDFLKNAERWSQMSPQERQTWRDLVTHVPDWSSLPPPALPPIPPLSQRHYPVAVTNPN
jgi:hypothetical protein